MKTTSLTSKKLTVLAIIFLAVVVVVFLFFQKFSPDRPSNFSLMKKTLSLGKKWDFPAANQAGTPGKTNITFSLVAAEKTNQIYVKNKPVRTTAENAFLIFSLELKNETGERVYFYSSDYLRLLSPEGKKFEADFKNPRLEIAPFSTKKDKLAFLVLANQNDFQIQIGEILGKPETVKISF